VVYFGGDDGDDIVAFDVDVDVDFVVTRICPTLFVADVDVGADVGVPDD